MKENIRKTREWRQKKKISWRSEKKEVKKIKQQQKEAEDQKKKKIINGIRMRHRITQEMLELGKLPYNEKVKEISMNLTKSSAMPPKWKTNSNKLWRATN